MIDAHSGTGPTTPPGGQFLHAYAERHNDPSIRNLITVYSQHMGTSESAIPLCRSYDLLCQLMRNAARAGPSSHLLMM
jgi:hypothetical protein